MRKFSAILSDGQIEVINKVLAFEQLAPVDLVPNQIIELSDVMVLTISRLAWLYSHELDRVEMSRILDLLDDVLHNMCSKSARLKSKKLVSNVKY